MQMIERRFMDRALELAQAAGQAGEVPVGCVIVRQGIIIGEGANRRERDRDTLGHAEMLAIAAACRRLGDWRLSDCTLYVTLEPCPMCAGAMINARMHTVVYGAADPAMGACGGVMNLFEEAFGHKPRLYSGLAGEECGRLLSDFFRQMRSGT